MVKCIHCGHEHERELRDGECRKCNKRQIHYPSIHLNGTGVTSLLAQYTEACHAVQHAVRALQEAAPNARDYYPQGDRAYGEAEREYLVHLRGLQGALKDLESLAAYCMEQRELREHR